MNRYPVIERSATALRWAALQAFFRTHFTWRRIGFGSYNAAVSELFWFFIYFGCMLLLGFLFLPETNQAQNTNVTIHRCSSLAVSQIPFVIGLASKNNVISWLTGLSYERLNFMHRNAARVLWVYSCYHTFGHIYLGLTGLHHLHQWYVGFGVVAFTAFNLIIILSFRPIRNRIYEVFLYSHICLVVIFIVSLLLHRMEYRGWIGVSLAIWSLDRFSRLLRIFAINRLWLILKGTVLDKSKASCELVTPELIRLSIPKDFGWKSGKHAFLCLPTISTLPFEFHPFTIGSLKRMDNERSSEVNFFIRVCNGMTKQLALRIERMGGHCEVPVLVDGPYGSSKNLHHFDEVLLVSGGTGVSYTFNRLSELAAKRIDKLSAVRKVTFVWVTRKAGEIALLEDLLVEILEATPPGFLDLQIYVTDKNFGRQCEKGGRSSFGRLGRYMKAGRPQMQRIVWQHITNKAGQVAIHCMLPSLSAVRMSVQVEKCLALTGCGPSPLSDSARIALADILSPSAVQTEKCAAVDLHVETFGF